MSEKPRMTRPHPNSPYPETGDFTAPPSAEGIGSSLVALEQFRTLLLTHRDLDMTLQGVCEQVVAALTTADMAGVTVLRNGTRSPETAAATDPRVVDVDIDQYETDEGPCLEAARTRSIVRVRVVDAAVRWPRFVATVEEVGIRSYLSAPLSLDEEHLGALNLYSYDDHGFHDIDEVLIKTYVTAVEAAVLHSRRARSAADELDGLQEAMRTRAVIEQAKGVLMALRGISADAAFEILSSQSQNRNIKLSVLAKSIVDTIGTKGAPKV